MLISIKAATRNISHQPLIALAHPGASNLEFLEPV